MFRAALLIACCWAITTTAAPAPQTSTDAFEGEGASPAAPSLGNFLQTLSTVTDLLNRFSRTFAGPAQYNEFDDVETAKPRVTLTEEKDAVGGSIYKVTIVRPAEGGAHFARQMQSTTAAPPPTATSSVPSQQPPVAPNVSPSSTTAAPAIAPPSTTANPALVAAEMQRRISELAFQLEQEENRRELEQDRQEMELERRQMELENQGTLAAQDLERRRQEQERTLELEERQREIQLEQALLDQERAILSRPAPLIAQTEAVDQATAPQTITRVIRYESRENESEERLLHALRQQNPNIQFVSRKAAPITSVDQRGRPIRYFGSPEISLEDRLRYGTNPRLVQVSRPGAQPVYRFADSDEVLYSTLHQPAQAAKTAAQGATTLDKQPLVVAPVAPRSAAVGAVSVGLAGGASAVDTVLEYQQRQRAPFGYYPQQYQHQQRLQQYQQQQQQQMQKMQQQPKYNVNHEMYSDEDEQEENVGRDEVDSSALSPIMVLLKSSQQSGTSSSSQQQRENLESLEEINKSGNRLDEDGQDELTEFEREWHYHPQPALANDMRVNRIFRTRNASYYNPDAEEFHHGSASERHHQVQKQPIK